MMLMILSAPYINNFNDVGGSMSRGNIGPKLYLTCIVPTEMLALRFDRSLPGLFFPTLHPSNFIQYARIQSRKVM